MPRRDSPERHRKQIVFSGSSFCPTTPQTIKNQSELLMYFNLCLYQHSGFVVNIVIIKVTLSIIGLDNSSYTSIQGGVSFGISGEYQKVRGIWTPANLVLMMMKSEIKMTSKRKTNTVCMYAHDLQACVCNDIFIPCTPQPA